MKKGMLIIAVGMLTACGSTDSDAEAKMDVTPETIEKIDQAQDVNVELEEIDGELDSLLTLLK